MAVIDVLTRKKFHMIEVQSNHRLPLLDSMLTKLTTVLAAKLQVKFLFYLHFSPFPVFSNPFLRQALTTLVTLF